MRTVNLNGVVPESNPLFVALDLADACVVATEGSSDAITMLAIDLMGDHYSRVRNPDAFAVLYGELLSIVPLLAAFSRPDADAQIRTAGALDFIWAYACDAYNHACELLGADPDRRHALAYAHIIAAYYRAMVERMRIEMAIPHKVLQ